MPRFQGDIVNLFETRYFRNMVQDAHIRFVSKISRFSSVPKEYPEIDVGAQKIVFDGLHPEV